MAEHKLVDGVQIPLSAEEIAQRQVNTTYLIKNNINKGNKE